MSCDKHIGNFIGDFSFTFLASCGRVVGPEVGPGRVGPRPYLVYSWRRHCCDVCIVAKRYFL